jgi:hypothetical protein
MDIWGHCATCDQWFRCEQWFDREAPTPCCPTCGDEPHMIENRSLPASGVSIIRPDLTSPAA